MSARPLPPLARSRGDLPTRSGVTDVVPGAIADLAGSGSAVSGLGAMPLLGPGWLAGPHHTVSLRPRQGYLILRVRPAVVRDVADGHDGRRCCRASRPGRCRPAGGDRAGRCSERRDRGRQPEKAPRGSLSIVVSGADKRALVCRKGVEIGRAQLTLAEVRRSLGTHAFIMQAGPGAGARPVALGRPAHRWIAVCRGPLRCARTGGDVAGDPSPCCR